MTLRPGGWGSRCAPRQWSGRRRPQNSSARGPEKATRWGFPGDAVARRVGESLCASSVVREAAPAKLVRPRPGRSACPEATAGPNPFRGRPSGLTRWRCGSAGGGVITCPSVARQGSSKGRPGGEMQSGTSARHYLFARGPAKAARQRQPGGVYPVALRSEGGRVIVVSLGPVGVCPSAVRPECVPGGNRRPQPLLRQPVRERTAVAHGADPSERSPAKIARP